jgi:hypothetical protein
MTPRFMFKSISAGLTVALAIIINAACSSPNGTEPFVTGFLVRGTTTMIVGEARSVIGQGRYSDGSTRDVTSQVSWSSDRPNVAAISAGGVVSPTGPGEALITGRFLGFTGALTVRVVPILPLIPGMTVSGQVSPDLSTVFTGEDYDSDYCRTCVLYSLTAPAESDVHVELRWSSSPPILQLWSSADGIAVTSGAPSAGEPSVTLNVPHGTSVHLFVGATAEGVGVVPFTLTATVASASAARNVR